MKNDQFVIDGFWKNYDVVMFYSRFEHEITATDYRHVVFPRFNMVLRNKKHHDIVVKISTSFNQEEIYYRYKEGTNVKTMCLNRANYTILLFDQIRKQWNEFGCYSFPSLTINNFTKFYFEKENEIRKKFHKRKDHPSVIKTIKDVMDEYIINELTKESLLAIEKILGY